MFVATNRTVKVLAEILSHRQIQRVVARQMARPVAIQKSRAVVDGHRRKAAPRQIAFDSRRKRVPLVVIEIKVPVLLAAKNPSVHRLRSHTLRLLVRVHQMCVVALQQQRRTHRRFQSLITAPWIVSGKKMFELPSASWSKKFLAEVWK